MPIYSYRCENCGHQQDALQKMSDPLLVTCAACGAPALKKQVTAAGFQLKGSGWYVTDFRNPASKEPAKGAPKTDGDTGSAKAEAPAAAADASKAAAPPSESNSAAPATTSPPVKPTAPASGTS